VSETRLTVLDHFAAIEDPRRAHGRLHRIGDIFAITLCAVISGADGFEQIGTFAGVREEWFTRLLGLPNGVPSHDTIRRVLSAVKPAAFEECFFAWMNACSDAAGLQRIHIDGKTLRGSGRKGRDGKGAFAPLHLVSAWAGKNGFTLGQVAVEGKSNEITAIPELLRTLELKGCIVTIDAMGCQKEIAGQIADGGGTYVLAVKENQPTLYADIDELFARALDTDFGGLEHETLVTRDKGHGREETRTYHVIRNPPGLSTINEWQGLQTVVMVTRERTTAKGTSLEHGYYIANGVMTAAEWAEAIRGHWSIENSLHWVLDVVFGEDADRTLDRNAAANLSMARKVALSLIKASPGKGSTPVKRLRAACNTDFLERVVEPLFAVALPPVAEAETAGATPG